MVQVGQRSPSILASLALFGCCAGAAVATGGVTAEIHKRAALVAQGQAVVLKVRAACPAGAEVLEAFAYVTQNDNQSSMAAVPLTCTGEFRRYRVRAERAPDSPAFQRGSAQASAYLIVSDPQTGTSSVSPSRTIKVR